MKISYCSDLHLEFLDFPSFANDKGGDVLILAGDTTTASLLRSHRTDADAKSHTKYMAKFKRDLIDKYNYVLYVIGNHEHYNSMFKETKNTLTEAFSRLGMEKIKILDNDMFVLENTAFIGATMWSDFLGGNPQSMSDCRWGMNDFQIIGGSVWEDNNGRKMIDAIKPEFVYQEFKQSLEFFKTMFSELKNGKKIVMITHHGPTMQSLNSRHSGNSLDGAFCSDLSELILDNPRITHWVHGHTHQNFDYMVGSCRVLANQRGYNSEHSYIDFEGTKSFEV